MGRGRRGLQAAAVLGVILAGLYAWNSRARSSVNVLLITLDTTRADRLGCYGSQLQLTPALDRLAGRGVVFQRAYTPAPLTLPSHASMFTGRNPPEHGLRANGLGRLPAAIPTLSGRLSNAGYDTAAFVASFVLNSKFGLQRGFAHYNEDMPSGDPTRKDLERQRDGRHVVDAALAWLDQPRSRPFLCWVHLYDAHKPYLARAEEFGERFADQPYDAEIAYLDLQVKRLLDYLDAAHLRERTVVIVAGDHGEGLGEHVEREHGLTLYNDVLQVPWIWAGPGVSAGRNVEKPVSLVDLTPTLLDFLGLSPTPGLSGRSLRQALTGGTISPKACYSATDDPWREHGCVPLRSLTTGFWKYVRSKDAELYDLAADPSERNNRAAELPDRVADLETQLRDMEHSFDERLADRVSLSESEQRALQSLGYLGGSVADGRAPEQPQESDIKERLPLVNAVEDAYQLQQTDPAAAAVQYRQILQQAPDYTLASFFLADSLARLRKFEEAFAELEKAADHHPDNRDIDFRIAGILVAADRLDEALEKFEATLGDAPAAEELFYVGNLLVQLGRPQHGKKFLERALECDPKLKEARMALGNIALGTRNLNEAEKQFQLALDIDSKSLEARMNLLRTLGGLQRYQDALPHAAAAVRLAPSNAELRFLHGTVLMALNRLNEAEQEFEVALRYDPHHAHAKRFLEQVRSAAHRTQ